LAKYGYWVSLRSGILQDVRDWLNRPRTVKFWLLAGAALVVVLLGIGQVRTAVDFWGSDSRSCGPNCVEVAPPLGGGVLSLVVGVGLLALGAVLVWLAARAYRVGPRADR
jgi:hypothetical protein